MLELYQLSKLIRDQWILDHISCTIEDGTIIGLLGPNHSGKSTLLKILAGFMRKTSGEIRLDGKTLPGSMQKFCSIVASDNTIPLTLTLTELLRWYPILYPDFDREIATEFCKEYLSDWHHPLSSFSQGEIALLNLIMGCTRKVRLYLLDEPLRNIDENAQTILLSLVSTCQDKSAIFLISSHDPREYETMLDQALILHCGKLVADEKPDLLRSKHHESLTEFYREVISNHEHPSV
jgi:ABC-2 type transport system ATP-binding protein